MLQAVGVEESPSVECELGVEFGTLFCALLGLSTLSCSKLFVQLWWWWTCTFGWFGLFVRCKVVWRLDPLISTLEVFARKLL